MTQQQITEEFIKEINNGYRSNQFQRTLDTINEDIISTAYLNAIDKVQIQKNILAGRNVKEFITATNDSEILRSLHAPPDIKTEKLANQFKIFADMLKINDNNIFFVQVEGNSMIKANIQNDDILVVSEATTATNNAIIIAKVNNNYYIKRYKVIDNKIWLFSENDAFKPVEITNDMDFQITGTVQNIIKSIK